MTKKEYLKIKKDAKIAKREYAKLVPEIGPIIDFELYKLQCIYEFQLMQGCKMKKIIFDLGGYLH